MNESAAETKMRDLEQSNRMARDICDRMLARVEALEAALAAANQAVDECLGIISAVMAVVRKAGE